MILSYLIPTIYTTFPFLWHSNLSIATPGSVFSPPFCPGSRVGRHISPTPCCSVNAFALELIIILGRIPTNKCHESLLMLFAILCANSCKLTITMGNHHLKNRRYIRTVCFFIVFHFSRIQSMIFSSTFHLFICSTNIAGWKMGPTSRCNFLLKI